MEKEDKESICLNCLYGNQPYGYYPIVCVHGKRSKDMYHDVFRCKHFEPCPEPETPYTPSETDATVFQLPSSKQSQD